MLDWKKDSDYQYTQSLKREQWAWEFLRRNPEYQTDYQWFISHWKALEKKYGKVPDLDYQAWKQDPLAYKIVDIASEQDGNCAVSDDKLLIECWMGYKWGFFKFPVEPALNALQIETSWRPLIPEDEPEEAHQNDVTSSDNDKSELLKTVTFDLSKPLKEQLERIKKQVIIAQRRLKAQGRLFPYTIAGKASLWIQCLRLLDAQNDNYTDTQINAQFQQENPDCNFNLIQTEMAYYVKNYLEILTLMEK